MQTEVLKLDDRIRTDPDAAYEFACRYLVAGFSSPGRIRTELDGRGFLVSRGEGAYLYDLKGQKYVDLNAGHGGALVGHSHPALRAALHEAIDMGILCGQETVIPSLVAQRICELVPCAEWVRLTFTGTCADALSIRMARAFTGRLKIIKFEGHYHGHNDSLQFSSWPSLDKVGPRSSPNVLVESDGLIPDLKQYMTILPWNDLDMLEDLLKREGNQTAAVIMEPINYNSGCIMPRPGYLEGVRALTQQYGIVLIFDEILSGFRTGPDCAQGYLGVTPDLVTLGKALGGGLPIGAVAGRKEIMSVLMPTGNVFNQGTYFGQVLVMHAAKAFLDLATDPSNWAHQERLSARLYQGLEDLFARYNAGRIQALGNRFSMLFGIHEPVWEYRQAAQIDKDLAFRFYKESFHHGVYFMHSWHHGYSWAHTEQDIDDALEGTEATLRRAVR